MAQQTEQLAASYRHCREVASAHAKSFYFSSFALPPAKRAAAYAIYSFCRYADDTIDVACEQNPDAKVAALEKLQADYRAILAGDAQALPFAPAFADTIIKYSIPEKYFTDLIHGVGMDIGRVRIQNWLELREYCYYVASVVGLIMAVIFGLDADDEAGRQNAIELGIAMQLTNILRDVAEDYQRDRVYLPAAELHQAGLSEDDLAGNTASTKLRHFISDQLARARSYYLASEPGIRKLDNDGSQLTVWTMRHVYSGILDQIESADCNVLAGRVATSFLKKLQLGLRAWRDCRKSK